MARSSPTSPLRLIVAAERMGEPAVESFSGAASLDTADRTLGYVVAGRWNKPSRFGRRPSVIKRLFTIADDSQGAHSRAAGAVVLSLSDEPGGVRVLTATIESLKVPGTHDGLLELIERRAVVAQADILRVTTSAAATRLAAIERGFISSAPERLATDLLNQVGVHVGYAIDLDRRFSIDPHEAAAYWRDGCESVVAQLDALLPRATNGRVGFITFDDASGRAVPQDLPSCAGATLRALSTVPLPALANVRIAGGVRSARLPVDPAVRADAAKVAWDHLVACVPWVAEKPVTIDLRDRLASNIVLAADRFRSQGR